MHETTLRVFSALRERTRNDDAEDYQTLNEIARDAELTLDEAADEMERLELIGAVESTDDDELAYRPRDVTVGTVADRMAALHRVPDDRRDEVLNRLETGEIDPGSLAPLIEALGITSNSGDDADVSTADTTRTSVKNNECAGDGDESGGEATDQTTVSPIERLARFVPGI